MRKPSGMPWLVLDKECKTTHTKSRSLARINAMRLRMMTGNVTCAHGMFFQSS